MSQLCLTWLFFSLFFSGAGVVTGTSPKDGSGLTDLPSNVLVVDRAVPIQYLLSQCSLAAHCGCTLWTGATLKVYIQICMYIYIYILCIHIYVYLYIYIHTCMYIYTRVCVCVCVVCVCMYIYIYRYVFVYIYTYIYI